ncbi:hypothetical protein FS749_015299 [Ceratobasidium sp. UAMH 11750]|nr:hypothetical protein FS749_015299 [Ceratobasidium sp. UAMH 11750]
MRGTLRTSRPYPFLGTYHGAELPMLFVGATPQFSGRNATTQESETATLLQYHMVAFANDPKTGLNKMGWPMYKPGNRIVVVSPAPSPPQLTPMKNASNPSVSVVLDSSIRYIAVCNA